MKPLVKLGMALVALLVFVCVATTIIGLLAPRQPFSSVSAVTPFAPRVAMVTTPSTTPIPPTISPAATPSPAPTSPTEDQLDQEYRDQIETLQDEFREAVSDMGIQINYASNDTSLTTQDEWKGKINGALDGMESAATRIRALPPTKRYAKAHERWIEFADHADKTVAAARIGVNSLDAAKLTETSDHLKNAKLAMDKATEEMGAAE